MFSRFFIERPRFALVVSLVISLCGILSLMRLPVAEYPEIAPPSLYVQASYTGAGAEEVAETVAIPLEDEINNVDDLLYFSSTCDNNGSYSCTVTFESGTDPDMALVNLQNAVKRAEPRLPAEVTQTGIQVQKRSDDMLAVIVFLTDGSVMDLNQLNSYVGNNVQDNISRVSGVGSASVLSGREYAMRIWFDPLRMAGLGISADDIKSAVARQNLQAAAGILGSEGSNPYLQYKITVKGRLVTAEEFSDIVIRSDAATGRMVKLSDVARVELGSSSYGGGSAFNAREAVGLVIYRAPEANALATMTLVQQELDSIAQRLPEGVTWAFAYDPTLFIEESTSEMITTLISALLLVVFITWLFLQNFRATLVPAIAIPVSLLGGFAVIYACGYSLNVLTMFGFILVIGSLVDDAIVVVENTQTIMEKEGLNAKEAAIKSMRQITGAVIATTLVTVACYVPLAFYGGMVGEIYLQFAVSMCAALCLSTVVALTLSPAICALVLRPEDSKPEKQNAVLYRLVFAPFNKVLGAYRGAYSKAVTFLVRKSLITALLLLGTFGLSWALFEHTPNSFLPDEDKGIVMCNVELQNNTSQVQTEKALKEIDSRIRAIPGVQMAFYATGFSILSGSGENTGLLIAVLDEWDERTEDSLSLSSIMLSMQEAVHDVAPASVVMFTPPAINGLGVTGGASFNLCSDSGADPAALSAQTMQLLGKLNSTLLLQYASSSYRADNLQLHFVLDRNKAELLNVGTQEVFATLQNAVASYYINDFTYEGANFEVIMQSEKGYRNNVQSLLELPVFSAGGQAVPLYALGTLEFVAGPNRIKRFNKMICADVTAQANPGVSSGLMYDFIDSQALPAGYHVEYTGLSYQERENEGQIVSLMALALLFAYLFLVAQYESFTMPIPVMLSVAFAVCGALGGIILFGKDLSIYAQLGLVMLIGLAAKNAILMVEFSKQEQIHGKGIEEAAISGGNLRLRAVLMTAWSFIFGVLPLVFASGAGAGSRQAIGDTTFSGMMLASFVGIVFTPALYALTEKCVQRFMAFWRRL